MASVAINTYLLHCTLISLTDQCDKETFVKLYALQKKKDEDEKEIKEAFRVLDKEKTGEIPVAELK